jgi:hypothetical protein
MKEELLRMKLRLKEENEALLKLIRELNSRLDINNHKKTQQKPKNIKL